MLGREKVYRALTDNLAFPNGIRVSDLEVEMYLRVLTHKEPVGLREIFPKEWSGELELHVVTLRVEISKNSQRFLADQAVASRITESELNVLEPRTSWKLKEEQLNFYVRADNAPALVAIEYRKTPKNPYYNPKIRVHKEKLENVLYEPTKEDFSQRKSFIRKPLSKKEIQENLIFMDAEFTTEEIDKKIG